MKTRRNLVVVRAGDQSVHPQWLSGGDRNFDIFVSYFGKDEGRYADTADYHENRKGMKWPVIGDLLEMRPELAARYAYFWFPDDDLIADTDTINRMFDFAAAYRLALSQPALTRDSYYTWPLLLQRDDYELRFTRFVEVMAPVMDRDALRVCLPTFGENTSGWGLDWLWPRMLESRGERAIAIIDATAVRHSRPVGGGELYKADGTSKAKRELQALLFKHGIDPGVLADGRHFSGGVRRFEQAWWNKTWLSLVHRVRGVNYRRLARRELRQSPHLHP